MSLILVGDNEVAIGEPLPWDIYDKEHNLLLAQGSVVRDSEHLNGLIASGACRELSWGVPDDENETGPGESEASHEQEEEKEKEVFTFDDMRLKVEDRLQLQPPEQVTSERFIVKVIGFIRGVSLLVSTPLTVNGLRLQVLEGERVILRSFRGQNAFGFACTVMRICKIPSEYLHLSFPDRIEGIVIRKAPRIRLRIIASVQGADGGEPVSALISNMSANGTALEARQPLGSVGDVVKLSFRVHLHQIDVLLSVKGRIRSVFTDEVADESSSRLVRHGIEFFDLQPNDSVILQSMIYQNMIESPHHLM